MSGVLVRVGDKCPGSPAGSLAVQWEQWWCLTKLNPSAVLALNTSLSTNRVEWSPSQLCRTLLLFYPGFMGVFHCQKHWMPSEAEVKPAGEKENFSALMVSRPSSPAAKLSGFDRLRGFCPSWLISNIAGKRKISMAVAVSGKDGELKNQKYPKNRGVLHKHPTLQAAIFRYSLGRSLKSVLWEVLNEILLLVAGFEGLMVN